MTHFAGFHGRVSRQIFLALDSNSCHNIIKLEQKFIVRTLGRPNWCNCFTAPKALQVTQDLPETSLWSRFRSLVVSPQECWR